MRSVLNNALRWALASLCGGGVAVPGGRLSARITANTELCRAVGSEPRLVLGSGLRFVAGSGPHLAEGSEPCLALGSEPFHMVGPEPR